MRMRRKPYARPELAACHFFIDEPPVHIGHWKELFNRFQPLYLELGCGKGGFIARLAADNANINYIGIDIKSEVLVVAKRNVEAEFQKAQRQIDNILLMSQEIEIIDRMLSNADVIDRIYINFCNPWSKPTQKKKRLTHSKQLTKYRTFLRDKGEIWFKTDDDEMFFDSIKYFQDSGFVIRYSTQDLASAGFTENIPTEHELMFMQDGIKIKMLIAVKMAMEGK